MKIHIKSFVSGMVIATAATFGITIAIASAEIKSAEYNQNKIVFDGKPLDIANQPMISIVKQNEVYASNYMPLRSVLEGMGYDVSWDDSTRTVYINSNKIIAENESKTTGASETEPIDRSEYEIKSPIFISEQLNSDTIEKITGASYKPNESVPLSDLRILTLTYIDYNDETQHGQMIVNKIIADEVVEIFEELYEARFPIEIMRLVDDYEADDNLSMKNNNTSAFNHRLIAGTGTLSNHAKGLAIDINPLVNPYISGNFISPIEGKYYSNRSLKDVKGMIVKGDVCYNAFVKRGWTWGGDWKNPKDYQHFEKP